MLRAFASGSIFGEQLGLGTAKVLALHGWGRDHHDFDRLLVGAGETSFGALAIDLPGFGSTPPPVSAWGTEQYARSIAVLLDELVDRPILLGHSFGGRVALQLAALYPERIGGLVLTGVPLSPPTTKSRPPIGYRTVRFLHRSHLLGDKGLERARQRYGSRDYRSADGVMRDVLVRAVNERYEEVISKVTAPVQLVWGETDTVVPLEQAKLALAQFSNAHLSVLASVGHLVPTEAPEALHEALTRLRP